MDKCCYNCALCSETCMTFVDSCDVDNHIIKDVFNEGKNCEDYIPLLDDVEDVYED